MKRKEKKRCENKMKASLVIKCLLVCIELDWIMD